jgi:hypothetical protein
MNPFVDPKKRSISLPGGCKDLADVLKRSEPRHDDAVRGNKALGSDLKGLLPKSIMQKFILNTRPTSKSENQLL